MISVLEVGTSNIFFFWINEQGEKELVTPYLDEGTILPGVMRDSILVNSSFFSFNSFDLFKNFFFNHHFSQLF